MAYITNTHSKCLEIRKNSLKYKSNETNNKNKS